MRVYSCGGCGRVGFGPEAACGHCGGERSPLEITGEGRIYSVTEVFTAPEGVAVPYRIALVDLEGAGRVMGRVEPAGKKAPSVGDRVRFTEFTERGPRFRAEGKEPDGG